VLMARPAPGRERRFEGSNRPIGPIDRIHG